MTTEQKPSTDKVEDIKNRLVNLVEEFACPGCQLGSDTKCGSYLPMQAGSRRRCAKQARGTSEIGPAGFWYFFLGMPKGFNRAGELQGQLMTFILKEDELGFDKFNVPVWKTKYKGHTLVRGMSPRINSPFLFIVEGQDRFDEIDCLEITEKDRKEMD